VHEQAESPGRLQFLVWSVEPLYKQNPENSYATCVCCVRATEVWEGACRQAIFRVVDTFPSRDPYTRDSTQAPVTQEK
jgi:hypothetical protein